MTTSKLFSNVMTSVSGALVSSSVMGNWIPEVRLTSYSISDILRVFLVLPRWRASWVVISLSLRILAARWCLFFLWCSSTEHFNSTLPRRGGRIVSKRRRLLSSSSELWIRKFSKISFSFTSKVFTFLTENRKSASSWGANVLKPRCSYF